MKKLLASALFGAAMLGVSMAQAATATTVLTFESVTTTALFNQFDEGDTFSQSGFVMTPYSPYADAGGTFVGQLIHGTDDPGLDVALPQNTTTTYYGAFNDSLLSISAADESPFHLAAVDASFIGSNDLGNYPSTAGFLGMFLSLADGSVVESYVALPGYAGGSFSFGRYNFGSSITSLDLIAVDFYAYNCNNSGTCTRFNSNKGQFALDNVVLTSEVTAVPEPDTYAMMLLGLAGVGAMARRRQRRAQAGA